MRIAQVAPPLESVPPAGYGGTERVISMLTEELVRRGHEVTLFAAGDSHTSAQLVPVPHEALWQHDPPRAWVYRGVGITFQRAAIAATAMHWSRGRPEPLERLRLGEGEPATTGGPAVARCEVCGNEYDKAFQIVFAQGPTHTFDSFECAIHALAPICEHCQCKVIGHGVEAEGRFFCCASCARAVGVSDVKDRT